MSRILDHSLESNGHWIARSVEKCRRFRHAQLFVELVVPRSRAAPYALDLSWEALPVTPDKHQELSRWVPQHKVEAFHGALAQARRKEPSHPFIGIHRIYPVILPNNHQGTAFCFMALPVPLCNKTVESSQLEMEMMATYVKPLVPAIAEQI